MSNPNKDLDYTFEKQSLYDFSNTFDHLVGENTVEFIKKSLAEISDDHQRVVDLGAGEGVLLRQMQNELERTGMSNIEFENVSLREMRKDAQIASDTHWNIKYTLQDVNEWLAKQPNQSIDVINTSHLLEHLENPLHSIIIMLTKLKNGGVLFCTAEFMTNGVSDSDLKELFKGLEYANFQINSKKTANGWAFVIKK